MKKIILLGLLAVIVMLFFQYDLEQYMTLDYLKAQQHALDQYYTENRALTLIGFFLIYVVVTGVSLPGATVMTLAAGAIFGLVTALVLVSFASTIGATVAFLVSRYLFRDMVESRFG
ncbi:MAG: TVP38/TMEM64 family protein, partial [Gammaproteobacteria bacterium]|nr:TVP38/TMEM64 family protein [Gammaproteobacteria bacterium]